MTKRHASGLYLPETERDACGMGFVAHIKGKKSRSIVEQALDVLCRLGHRAACGCDPETGDGAGLLIQLPHRFFKAEGKRLGFDMPRRRRYGVGQVFLPSEPRARAACEETLAEAVAEEGQLLLGWRDVPVDPAFVGPTGREVLPCIRQLYVRCRRVPPSAFDRKLYVIRKLAENRVRERGLDPDGMFHVASMSSETIVYKGLLLPAQLPLFYQDLQHPDMVSAIAVLHSRFSTNTFPTWDLAQPFHCICHNGEINTVRGNRNWMAARRSQLQTAKFGASFDRLFPIIQPGLSDSAQFDNMIELLHLAGRSLPHAIMMMIPEAWQHRVDMRQERRDCYEYLSSLMEPWDGPAAIAFTDGTIVGATLDRNGLRPARYMITEDDLVILASETGVVDVAPEQVRHKGRLRPGKMLLVDTGEGLILDDEELKEEIVSRWPYGKWLRKNRFVFANFPAAAPPPRAAGAELQLLQRAFGYTDESVDVIIQPMAATGKEPTGSMGSDTPLAVLSQRAPRLFAYFHQLFAQVTNPAIDPIRESLIMNLQTAIGPEGNTFEETPEQCHRIGIPAPILTNKALAKIVSIHEGVFEPTNLSLLYESDAGESGAALEEALGAVCVRAAEAIDEGYNVLVLSDRGVDAQRVAIPSLLAVSAVHQHLVRIGTRMQAGLVVETGEAFEVHDFALLIGYGAAAVNPYLALDTTQHLADSGAIDTDASTAEQRYIEAIDRGLLKIMAKMGISTIESYRGAHIFEAVGLHRDLVETHFTGTPSRIGGIGLSEIAQEVSLRHDRGFGTGAGLLPGRLSVGGEYQWRRRGERHKWTPATIAKLQAAVCTDDPAIFAEYSRLVDDEEDALCTIRGLLDFDDSGAEPVPIDEVEPATEIARRFVTGAMSFGSLGPEAHETLAIAMNRLGAKSNSGEGGEEARRYVLDDNGDSRRSAIKQVASGRFGVTAHYLANADEIQIKIAQGAKPGEGGQLPGDKVDERIAEVRCSTPGVTLISPPPHHDIYSIEDLAQLVYDLQVANPEARISVKLVSEVGVGTVAAGVAKARAGAVVIAGFSGGTGASPVSSIKHAGLPWELGLAETQQVLVQNRLRDRIRVQVDGGLRTGRDVAIAALLGAEEFGMATAPLIAMGCVMLRKCHLNTCSAGIATQDPELRRRFAGEPEHVMRLVLFVAEQVRQYMARLGFRTLDEMVGRVDRLRVRPGVDHWKAEKLDLSPVLAAPPVPAEWARRCITPQPWSLDDHIDRRLLPSLRDAIDNGTPAETSCVIHNTDRAAGTLISHMIARTHGSAGLPKDTIRIRMEGSAGQSFGAFLAAGVTLELVGDSNDYLGKGLSGGRIIVYPQAGSRFAAEDNVIIGNTVLYGATGGELYASGLAGERFAVRNSGARAVVEGVGDHGCEYMTGGVVVVIGETGRNFAAGMSGGVAYVFDREQSFRKRCNLSMVELEALVHESEIWLVYGMIEDHVRQTRSSLGRRILDNWETVVSSFVKVMPIEYKRVLQARRARMRPPGALARLRALDGGKE